MLVNSKTLSKLALKMTVKALKSLAYALNKICFQSMDFRARHSNQQSLIWPIPNRATASFLPSRGGYLLVTFRITRFNYSITIIVFIFDCIAIPFSPESSSIKFILST